MPAEIVISVSEGGERFREIARLATDVPEREEGVVLRDMLADLPASPQARYVRFLARSRGTIPDWHPGRGDRAYIFIDELIVE